MSTQDTSIDLQQFSPPEGFARDTGREQDPDERVFVNSGHILILKTGELGGQPGYILKKYTPKGPYSTERESKVLCYRPSQVNELTDEMADFASSAAAMYSNG